MNYKRHFYLITIFFVALISPLAGSSNSIEVTGMPESLLKNFNAALGFIANYDADNLFNLMSDSIRSEGGRGQLRDSFRMLKDNMHYDYSLTAISFIRVSDEHYETMAELAGTDHSVGPEQISKVRSIVRFHWEKLDGAWRIIHSEL